MLRGRIEKVTAPRLRADSILERLTKFYGKEDVYFVRCQEGGLVKIGSSRNPRHRLTALQIGCPFELTMVGTFPKAGERGEAFLHDTFAHLNVRGEWFRPDLTLRFVMDSVRPIVPVAPNKDIRANLEIRRKGSKLQIVDRCLSIVFYVADSVQEAQTFHAEYNHAARGVVLEAGKVLKETKVLQAAHAGG